MKQELFPITLIKYVYRDLELEDVGAFEDKIFSDPLLERQLYELMNIKSLLDEGVVQTPDYLLKFILKNL